MAYLIATGHDVVLGSLAALAPQPATAGMQHGRRTHALSGDVIDELPFVEFRYNTLSVAQYQSLLTQFGLTSATTAEVTVYIQDEDYNWVQRNGIAVKPQIGNDGQRRGWLLKDFVVVVHSLRALA